MKNEDGLAEDPSSASFLETIRRAASTGGLGRIRPEAIVAIIQRLDPRSEANLLRELVLYISDLILRLLRRRIGTQHRNEGRDMIEAAHGKLIGAVLTPGSADGAGMTKAFVKRVHFRADDEIVAERKERTRFQPPAVDEEGQEVDPEDIRIPPDYAEQNAYVEELLSKIEDERKRKAFRLHMEGVPAAPGKGTTSISRELGISAKTAGDWIREVQDLLIKAGVKK